MINNDNSYYKIKKKTWIYFDTIKKNINYNGHLFSPLYLYIQNYDKSNYFCQYLQF